ncbi:nicotinate phosphoribosyltransferase [Cladochytrium replicatum]|nr:nicotinate phosphoribosyltransferase [Cladochytrium replicatum]
MSAPEMSLVVSHTGSNQPHGMPITSLLDNDLYKFTMQQAIMAFYPGVQCTYKFKNRGAQRFSRKAYLVLLGWIQDLSKLKLKDTEATFLASIAPTGTPLFSAEYIQFLRNLTLNPSSEVSVDFLPNDPSNPDSPGNLDIKVIGVWDVVILYEVIVMALISEAYFTVDDQTPWDLPGQAELARKKFAALAEGGCVFSEFGGRRRRSWAVMDTVVRTFAEEAAKRAAGPIVLTGTSNVQLAMKYNLRPIGTVAHEWTMAISALENKTDKPIDFETVNPTAILRWNDYYKGNLAIALTDTYTSALFFSTVTGKLAQSNSLRQDSGNPFQWACAAARWYWTECLTDAQRRGGESPLPDKLLVFSDSLSVEKAVRIQRFIGLLNESVWHAIANKTDLLQVPSELPTKGAQATPLAGAVGPFKAMFGIGTHFTNDFEKSPALNIVIKLSSIEVKGVQKPLVKLSDDQGKHQGDSATVESVLMELEEIKKRRGLQ